MKLTIKELKQLVIESLLEENVLAPADLGSEAGTAADPANPQGAIEQAQASIAQSVSARENAAQALVAQATNAMARAIVFMGVDEDSASDMITDLDDYLKKMISNAKKGGQEALETSVEAGGLEE